MRKETSIPTAELMEDVDVALAAALPVSENADDEVVAAAVPAPTEATVSYVSDRHDPLSSYLAALRRYPLLSREDETRVARHYKKTGDAADAEQLVQANLRLVVKLAREYRKANQNLLDLVQEGNVGLVRSLETYDPERGIRLSTYASWWIRAFMLKFILDDARLVRFGKTEAQRKLFFNLRSEKQRLEARGIQPTAAAIAESLHVPEEAVVAMEQRLAQPELSLDAPVGRDGSGNDRTHIELLEAPASDRPDQQAEAGDFRERVHHYLSQFGGTLQGRERAIFTDRLVAAEPKTLQELGDRFGISRERARQVEMRLVQRLKSYLGRQLGDAALAA